MERVERGKCDVHLRNGTKKKIPHLLPFIFSTDNSNRSILDSIITLHLLLHFALCDKSYSPKDNAPKCTYHYSFLPLFQPTI